MNQLQHFHPMSPHKKILFCGDDDLDRAAIYLGAILHQQEYSFDYIPSTLAFPENVNFEEYRLIILSDYPRSNLSEQSLNDIKQFVSAGGNLLMIGGWESFTGLEKEYTDTVLHEVLPVKMLPSDDRVNLDQGCIVQPALNDHPVVKDLDWAHPGIIGGYNRIYPKTDSTVILNGNHVSISINHDFHANVSRENIPLLIEGRYQNGKTGALAFDLAPHWIGGMVDWGSQRTRIDFNDMFIEVGSEYCQFVSNLIAYFYK